MIKVNAAVFRQTPVSTACIDKRLGVELTMAVAWAEVERLAGVILQAQPCTRQVRVGAFVAVAMSVQDVVRSRSAMESVSVAAS